SRDRSWLWTADSAQLVKKYPKTLSNGEQDQNPAQQLESAVLRIGPRRLRHCTGTRPVRQKSLGFLFSRTASSSQSLHSRASLDYGKAVPAAAQKNLHS